MFVLSRPVQRSFQRSHQFDRFVDRLFADAPSVAFSRDVGGSTSDINSRTPALDVSETDSAYTVAFDVPGVAREQLKVSIDGRRVSIETVDLVKAEAPAEADSTTEETKQKAPRVLYRERSAARYARTVSLPTEVDQSASSARFDNGVLILTLAKKVPTGATTLNIS